LCPLCSSLPFPDPTHKTFTVSHTCLAARPGSVHHIWGLRIICSGWVLSTFFMTNCASATIPHRDIRLVLTHSLTTVFAFPIFFFQEDPPAPGDYSAVCQYLFPSLCIQGHTFPPLPHVFCALIQQPFFSFSPPLPPT